MLELRTIRRVVAAIALAALAAADAPQANHFILPCAGDCTRPRWVPTGNLNVARNAHTATLLQDGRVLVVGGQGTAPLDSAELYEPSTAMWSLTAPMSVPRIGHSATLLSDGRVLVAGGLTKVTTPPSGPVGTAALFDPVTGTWSSTGSMRRVRVGHTATRLRDGKVLVAGGFDKDALGSAEVYDPATGEWSITGNLYTARYGHTATLLQDGGVLVAGGSNDGDLASTLSSAEVYDPIGGAWSVAGDSQLGGVLNFAILLSDGKVLMAGGNAGGVGGDLVLDASELFDAVTRTWRRAGDLRAARYGHAATLLASGKVLLTGGSGQIADYPYLQYGSMDSTEQFDPETATWTDAPRLINARSGHTATQLFDGNVLVTGGAVPGPNYSEVPLRTSEFYVVLGTPAQAAGTGAGGRKVRPHP